MILVTVSAQLEVFDREGQNEYVFVVLAVDAGAPPLKKIGTATLP